MQCLEEERFVITEQVFVLEHMAGSNIAEMLSNGTILYYRCKLLQLHMTNCTEMHTELLLAPLLWVYLPLISGRVHACREIQTSMSTTKT